MDILAAGCVSPDPRWSWTAIYPRRLWVNPPLTCAGTLSPGHKELGAPYLRLRATCALPARCPPPPRSPGAAPGRGGNGRAPCPSIPPLPGGGRRVPRGRIPNCDSDYNNNNNNNNRPTIAALNTKRLRAGASELARGGNGDAANCPESWEEIRETQIFPAPLQGGKGGCPPPFPIPAGPGDAATPLGHPGGSGPPGARTSHPCFLPPLPPPFYPPSPTLFSSAEMPREGGPALGQF